MLLSWLKSKIPSSQLWWEFVHERLPLDARLWVRSATSSNWELEAARGKVRSRVVLASRSRCAYTRLSGDFMLGHIILSFTGGTWSRFDFIPHGRYRSRGSTASLSARASIPLFPLQGQVHGARNMRAKCFSLMLSTFGCACLVCFYGMKKKKKSWKRPGRPSLTRRLGAAREQQRPHNSACSRGWSQCAVGTEESSVLHKSPGSLESHLGRHLIMV